MTTEYTPKKSESVIDPDKTTSQPGLIAFAHMVGGAVIRPDDVGKIKSKALVSMRLQTEKQYTQLYEQMQLLATQATALRNRIEISERIYACELKFEPVIGESYYLYQRADGSDFLSIVPPELRGKSMANVQPISKVTLLPDHTWDVSSISDKL